MALDRATAARARAVYKRIHGKERCPRFIAGTVVCPCAVCGAECWRLVWEVHGIRCEERTGTNTCVGGRICNTCDDRIERQSFPRRKLRETNPKLAKFERDFLAGNRSPRGMLPNHYLIPRPSFDFHADVTVVPGPPATVKLLTKSDRDRHRKAATPGQWKEQMARAFDFPQQVDTCCYPIPKELNEPCGLSPA